MLVMLSRMAAWSADGDTFTATTIEGVEMTFEVISEVEKTCQPICIEGRDDYFPCISMDYEGCITIPKSVDGYNIVAIGNHAFYESRITSVVIPEGVELIDKSAFFNCYLLTNVVVPNGVKRIESWAFYSCDASTISLPPSLETIGQLAFAGSRKLTTLIANMEHPMPIEANVFPFRQDITLYVPKGCIENYVSYDYWKDFKEIKEIETGVQINMMPIGCMTYCSNQATNFTEVSGLKAYIASGFSPTTGELLLTRVYHVPAGEGVLLVGEAGDYEIPYGETDMIYSNLLKGVTTATTIQPIDGGYTNFILDDDADGIVFHTVSETGETIAGQAYLQLSTSVLGQVSNGNIKICINNDVKGDVNEDGEISISDAVSIVNIILGNNNSNPAGARIKKQDKNLQ